MPADSKKTERLQLRMTETMAREARALAQLEFRTIQDELCHLISVGLDTKRAINSNGSLVKSAQAWAAIHEAVLPDFPCKKVPQSVPGSDCHAVSGEKGK